MNVHVGSIHNHTYNHTTTQMYPTLCNTNDHVQCLNVLKSYDIFPLYLIYEERQEEKRKQRRREKNNEINTQRKNYHTVSCEKDCTWFYFRDNVDFFSEISLIYIEFYDIFLKLKQLIQLNFALFAQINHVNQHKAFESLQNVDTFLWLNTMTFSHILWHRVFIARLSKFIAHNLN